MNVYISKKAELFHKAIDDVWIAEQIWMVSPNNAVWHCTQAAEKMMKGLLRSLSTEYDHGHELKELLNAVEPLMVLQPETIKNILYLNGFSVSLRYKHMSTDPSAEEAKVAIVRTKQIMQEFSNHPGISQYIKEAKEVHTKILKAAQKKDAQ